MKKVLLIIIATTFLSVGVFGLSAMATMDHGQEMGGMSNCPFVIGETVLCEMNVLDHIASWQAMFTSLAPELVTLAILLLAMLLAWATLRHLFDPPDISKKIFHLSYLGKPYTSSLYSLLLGSTISPRAP